MSNSLFVADDGVHGREIWITDGTSAGTRMLIDLDPGAAGSDPVLIGETIFLSGTVFWFTADDGTHGRELWVTDGTIAGTHMVKDINTGIAGSAPGNLVDFGMVNPNPNLPPLQLAVFPADDGVHGRELWISDGTDGGTHLLVDANAGSASSNPEFFGSFFGFQFNDEVSLYLVDDGVHGREPWVVTATGAHLFQDINPGSSGSNATPWSIVYTPADQPKAYVFTANDGVHGQELWAAVEVQGPDGPMVQLTMLKDINVGAGASAPVILGNPYVGGSTDGTHLVFTADDGVHGRELWVTDGTAAGTQLFLDINPGGGGSNVSASVSVNSHTLFTATDGAHGQELWVTDATPPGTHMLVDINSGSGASNPVFLDGYGGHQLDFISLLFTADDGTHGDELWTTDGTAAGTHLFKDIDPGSGASNVSDFQFVGAAGAVFAADDGVHGRELWVTDGTSAGTHLLADLNPGAAAANPTFYGFTDSYSNSGPPLALYLLDDGVHGRELWATDGTAAGTHLFKDINAGAGGSTPTPTLLLDFSFDGEGLPSGATINLDAQTVTGGGYPSTLQLGGFTFNAEGTAYDDVFIASGGISPPPVLRGGGGNDLMILGGGQLVVDGGVGNDSALFAGLTRAHTIAMSGGAGTVDGATLTSVENIGFADGVLTFDQNSAAAVVMRMYDTALHRLPDTLGGQYWTHTYESGAISLTNLAQAFANSTEFQNDVAGMSNRQIVDFMYENTLHRSPDQGGEDAWTAFLDAGHGLGELVLQFSESDEHKALTAPVVAAGLWDGDAAYQTTEFMYEAAFGRLPDAGGLVTWANALKGGLSLHDMAVDFTSSGEFFNNTQGMSHLQLVDYLYETALHRAPDPVGETSWTIYLDNGGSPADLVLQFEQSAELQLGNAGHIDHGAVFS